MLDIDNNTLMAWAITLMVCVPLITVILGEIIDRLRSSGNQYRRFFEVLRAVVLPAVTSFIVAKFLFHMSTPPAGLDGAKADVGWIFPIILSVLYVSLAYAAFIFLRTLKFEKDPKAWENRIPGLFKAILTILVFGIPIIFLLGAWGIKVGNFAKYASLAAAATAFALQDALSSITKGFLLVLDKPFAVGDWIEVDGIKGQVIDISWRSTRLQVAGNDIVIIPNLIISDNSVYNFTAEDISYRDNIVLGFSYNDSPNRVKEIMLEVLQDCPDIAKIPAPIIYTISYDDFSIGYKLYFHVNVYVSSFDAERIRDDVMNRVWYAAARGGISIPFPINVEGPPKVFEPNYAAITEGVFNCLCQNRYFSALPKDTLRQLANVAELAPFASGETLFTEGEISQGINLIRTGEVRLHYSAKDGDGTTEIARENDIISEISLLGKRANPSTARAVTDTEVLKLSKDTLTPIIEKHPKFARQLNTLIESRMLHVQKGNTP